MNSCGESVIAISKEHELARKYLVLPHICNLISYRDNIVATISEEYRDIVENYINKYSEYRCFETPNMHVLNDAFQQHGCRVCFMAEYFLPDVNVLKALSCEYEMRVLQQEDFKDLYTDEWSNALCEERKHLDVLGVGAYHDGNLIGLAGCSADCDTMWKIGGMCFQNIAEKESHRLLQADWLLKSWKEARYHFIAVHGRMLNRPEMR